jgi:pimeloyl-ACP methyl ester carboxylesterase
VGRGRLARALRALPLRRVEEQALLRRLPLARRVPGRGELSEGFVAGPHGRTWYRVSGEPGPGTLPLLCLHGGPGSSHAYFGPLEQLADEGRQVVVYDQIGCGDSDRPEDVEWSVELFVEEVGAIRAVLGLERIHLLGQSWGGILAQEYALTQPEGLASLVLSSTLASADQWVAEQKRLLADLGPGAGDPEYRAAHFCRLDPQPPEMQQWQEKRNVAVYEAMWGPNEWTATGVLAGWDRTDRLGEIDVPTLVLSGRYDACTPAVAETLTRGIPGAEHVLFEHSAHIPFVEEPERYRAVLADFLERVER